LKLLCTIAANTAIAGFKASETLLGIETDGWCFDIEQTKSFKASETLLGIETAS